MKPFTYLVTRADAESLCMDVLYVADGYEPVLVGVRAPREGESLEALLLSAAPIGVWDDIDMSRKAVVMPEQFTSGRIELPIVPPDPPAQPEMIQRREVVL